MWESTGRRATENTKLNDVIVHAIGCGPAGGKGMQNLLGNATWELTQKSLNTHKALKPIYMRNFRKIRGNTLKNGASNSIRKKI